jgi:hypothetical protein
LDRLAEVDVLPSFETFSRKELEKRKVAGEAISAISGGGYNDWEVARELGEWLKVHPKDSVLLICNRFRSAVMRRVLDASLDGADAARVRIKALPDRLFDEGSWWQYRSGYLSFGFGWLARIQNWIGWGQGGQIRECNADEFERKFLESVGTPESKERKKSGVEGRSRVRISWFRAGGSCFVGREAIV